MGYIGDTWRIRLKLCTLAPPDEYDWTCPSFGQHDSTTQKVNRSVQLFLHSSRQKVPTLYDGRSFPKKLPFSWVDLDACLVRDSLGQSEPTVETASRSVQLFSHRWPQSVPFSKKLPLSVWGSGTLSNTWFPRPMRAHNSNGISIGSAIFAHAHMTAECLCTLLWDAPFPSKFPLPMAGYGLLSNTWFQGNTQVLNPNGMSIGSAVFAGLIPSHMPFIF